MSKLAILNAPIVTAEGNYKLEEVSLQEAKKLVQDNEILSAVAYQSTAEMLSELLETEIPVNPIEFVQQTGQKALILKLNARLKAGEVSVEQINKIGYKFQILTKTN